MNTTHVVLYIKIKLKSFIPNRSCGSAVVILGSPSAHSLSAGTVRGWMWSLANTGSPSAQTVKVSTPTLNPTTHVSSAS